MRLVKASYEIKEPTINYLTDIEEIARTCYKSEDKLGSNPNWVKDVLISKRHLAMVEHGTIYLTLRDCGECNEIVWFYQGNKFSVVNLINGDAFITTNYRVILDNNREEDLKYQTSFIENGHERRISVHFVIDRGVSHEFVRNRGEEGNSFAQESTRYCCYALGKFGMSCTFIDAPFIKEGDHDEYEKDLKVIEDIYFKWVNKGYKAQEARGFLCNFLKTELWITGTMHDWGHFLFLRADKAAHPQAQEVAYPLKEEFLKRGWLTEDDICY